MTWRLFDCTMMRWQGTVRLAVFLLSEAECCRLLPYMGRA